MRFWRRSNKDFDDEVESHLALETDRLIAQGVAPDEAAAQARRAFGNVTVTREQFRLQGSRIVLEQIQQDLGYAVRSLRRSPSFAIIAIACLAVGISVNTAAFSVLNGLLFRDFPGVVAQRDLASIRIGFETPWGRSNASDASPSDWEEFRGGMPALSAIGAIGITRVSARSTGEPEAVRGDFLSPGFFEMLGTTPANGRFFARADEAADANTVVLSYEYWERAFELDPRVVGRAVTIGTHPFTIIGVAPRGFVGLYPGAVLDADVGSPQLFLPLNAAPLVRSESAQRDVSAQINDRWLMIAGRKREGASLEQVKAQATGVAARIAARFPDNRKNAFVAVLGGGGMIARPSEAILGVVFVMAVPVILLLVACANLANSMLTRGVQRGREIAVRLSLGATRARVVRQLLVEAGAIAFVASAVGLLFARWILDILRAFFLTLPYRIPLDGRVLLFTFAVATLTAIVFGLVPALRATRMNLGASLKERVPGTGFRQSRLQATLIVVQIAASLGLIAVSNVFVRAARSPAVATQPGTANNLAIVSLEPELLNLSTDARRAYQASLMDRVNGVPGVVASAIASYPPMQQPNEHTLRDVTHPNGEQDYDDVAEVSGDWFAVQTPRIIEGRLLTAQELAGPPTIGVVDAAFARNWWRDSSALGRSIQVGDGPGARVVTIVGVIDTIWGFALERPEGQLIIPGSQRAQSRTFLYVRTNGPAAPMLSALQSAVRSVDQRMPMLWARTAAEVNARQVAPMTMVAQALAGLGLIALALASLGLFGVMSFVVAQRRREIGVRVALGARRQDVTWMVLRQAMTLGAVGATIGAAIAIAAVIMFRSIMHGLPGLDPVNLALAAAAMCAVAAFASLVPARSAARVDPVVALRDD
ncbi:MAG TPA: ADOP family duplicated permease [Gemmatimonadaceae bacterium]|nr:ADOP family duplicated permease [Gemmatimonadaceae bacterium]